MRSRTLGVLLLAGVAAANGQAPLGSVSARTGLLLRDDTARMLIHSSSGDLAFADASRLAGWVRLGGTELYREAARWLVEAARKAGLEDVQVERYPADGKARYFTHRPSLDWNVRRGELWMKAPQEVRITTFEELPLSLCRNSTSADVEAELVDIGAGVEAGDYRESVEGKIVLTSSDPAQVVRLAVREGGALGIVSYWTIPEWDRANRLPGDYPDLAGWRALPAPEPGGKGTFAFMISPSRAAELMSLLRRKTPVRLRAVVETEAAPGELEVVTGLIRGSRYPDVEIILYSHLDEIGADDNASGNAVMLEMGRTLKRLVDNGRLPPPPRSIRFVWGPEFGGTYAWLSRHLRDPVKRIAALNFDQCGGNLTKLNAVYTISYTPDAVPSFLNALLESILDFMNQANDARYPEAKDFQIISVRGTRNRLQGIMTPYIAGSDHQIYNWLGIPSAIFTTWPENYYHSSQDTPDKLDPTQLHRSAFAGLAALVTMAYAGKAEAAGIAQLSLLYGQKRIQADRAKAARSLLSATPDELADAHRWARNAVRHAYRREAEAVKSASVFVPAGEVQPELDSLAEALAGEERASVDSLRRLAEQRAKSSGRTLGQYRPGAAEENAARLIPRRLEGQELLGADHAFEQASDDSTLKIGDIRKTFDAASRSLTEQGAGSLRLMGLLDAPACYADGKRSLLEIRDAVAAEYAPLPLEVLELYFRAFERAGVMRLERR